MFSSIQKSRQETVSPDGCLLVLVNTEEEDGRWCETVGDGGFSSYKDVSDVNRVDTV